MQLPLPALNSAASLNSLLEQNDRRQSATALSVFGYCGGATGRVAALQRKARRPERRRVARRRAQDAWPLPRFVCSSRKSFGKAAWSRQVTQEKWYAPLRQSGSCADCILSILFLECRAA